MTFLCRQLSDIKQNKKDNRTGKTRYITESCFNSCFTLHLIKLIIKSFPYWMLATAALLIRGKIAVQHEKVFVPQKKKKYLLGLILQSLREVFWWLIR